MPAFAFSAEAGTHLPTPEGWKAELAFVCMSASESVSPSRKRVEHPTNRNFPPMFAKFAAKIESQEMYGYLLFWWKSKILLSATPEVELIVT